MILPIWGIQKNGTNELIYKTETESQMQKTNLQLPGYKKQGGINWEIETDVYTLLNIKQRTSKDLLYRIRNSSQYSVIDLYGKRILITVDICISVIDLLFCIPVTNTTL